ncbi:MAG TPA: signal peptidase II [Gemmatimonadota bacterium]|jgi:signal peptidase II|nr:signal peptidase II [Gemmatimonadota bacterium]
MEGASEAISAPRPLRLTAVAALPVAVLVLDQLTKWWVQAELTLNQPVRILGDNVRLLYIHNEGAAFGISVGEHSPTLFLVLASAASILVLYLLLVTPAAHHLQRFALGLILGGAVGNIVDRVRFGQVVDFIQVGVSGHYWPIFNVADSAVTVGAVLLGIAYLSDR